MSAKVKVGDTVYAAEVDWRGSAVKIDTAVVRRVGPLTVKLARGGRWAVHRDLYPVGAFQCRTTWRHDLLHTTPTAAIEALRRELEMEVASAQDHLEAAKARLLAARNWKP